MINFEGYYFVAAEKIECISTKIGDDAPKYGLFLNLTSGRELGVWYKTEELRRAAYANLVRQIETDQRRDAEAIMHRLYRIEDCVNRTDKRTLKIWRQLKGLLHLGSEVDE